MGTYNVFAHSTVSSINILFHYSALEYIHPILGFIHFSGMLWVNTFSITMQIYYKSNPFTVYKGKSCSKSLMVQYLPMQVQLGGSHPIIYYVHIFNLMNTNCSIGTTLLLENVCSARTRIEVNRSCKGKIKILRLSHWTRRQVFPPALWLGYRANLCQWYFWSIQQGYATAAVILICAGHLLNKIILLR